jgi:hypothetical protein
MKIPPALLNEELLSGSASDLHEALVSIFGGYLMWSRDQALSTTRMLVESESAREKIGRVFRGPYDEAAASLSDDQIRIAENLQNEAILRFIQFLAGILAGSGFDKPVGDKHFARFRLVMELIDKDTDSCVLEEVLNRDGRRVFWEYLKNWRVAHPWSGVGQEREPS